MLALHSDVARAVAEQIRLELTPQEQAALTPTRTVDPRAYDAYLRGRELIGPTSLVPLWGSRAIEQLERAVEIDPDFAEAWAWIAHIRDSIGNFGLQLRNREQYPRAREAAQRALELDDHVGMAHTALGSILMHNAWDFAGAEREFERAIELSPSDPAAVNGLAWYLLLIGKSEQGLALSERLPSIAPFDIFFRAERFRHLRFARQYDRALEELARVRELVDPAFTDSLLPNLYSGLGRSEEAHRALIAFYEQCGSRCEGMRNAAMRGWAEGGWEGSTRAIAEVLASIEGFSPNVIAIYYSVACEVDEAIAWLEEGYRQREPLMTNVKSIPDFDLLRSDPRFEDLVRRIGFPES